VPGLPSEAEHQLGSTYLNSAGQKVEVQDALWKPGKPAQFNESFLEGITYRLTNVLAESGCFSPLVRPRVVPRPGTDLADLYIDLDECRHGTVGRVQLLGLKRNSREAVLQWLGLRSGQSMTNDLIGRLERQLWNSARFLTYRIVPSPSLDQPDVVDLQLRLEELPEAPLLADAFSREEQVALKARDWILNAPALGDDVVISAFWSEAIGEIELILSGHGALVINRQNGSTRYTALVGRGRAQIHSLLRQRLLALGGDNNVLGLFLSILPQEETSSSNRFNIQLGAGITPSDKEFETNPLKIRFALAPVAFIDIVRRTNQTLTFEGDTLVIVNQDASVKIDSSSGRLLELNIKGMDEGSRFRARTERGAFDRKWKELTTASAPLSDKLVSHPRLSAQLGIAAGEAFHLLLLSTNLPKTTAAQRDRAEAVMEKVSTQMFASLDAWLATNTPGTNAFSIPAPAKQQLNTTAMIAAWIFGYADQLLPARSWPWTLAHESVFVLAGQSGRLKAELQSIHSSTNLGPLAFLSTALLLNLIGSPAAPTFASRGLERLSPQDFQRDCRPFLDPQTPVGGLFHDAARVLRDLPADDLDVLAAVLPIEHGVFLRVAVNRLKSSHEQSLADTLAPLLEQLWVSALRQRIENSLRAIAGDSTDTAEQQQYFEQGVKAHERKLYAEAARWFRNAAELEMPRAQYVLAQYLEQGIGESRDETSAAHWYHRAASNGVTEAQMVLGARYSLALDNPAELVEAFYWYSLAARGGNRAAETLRNSAGRKLTPAQLEAVARRLEADKTGGGR
jgi:hypothetical protein